MCQERKLLLLLLAVFHADRASGSSACEAAEGGGDASACCQEAFDDRCYSMYPMKACCHEAKCSPHSTMKCKWKFDMPCCEPLADSFDITSTECLEACEVLGSQKYNYTDYCPDGALWQNSLIQTKCPAARNSLKKALDKSQENNKWCSSLNTVNCTFAASFYSKKDEELHETLHGSFVYTDDAHHFCANACKSLKEQQLTKDEYCDRTSTFHQTLVLCDPLRKELKNQCPQAYAGTELKRHGFTAEVAKIPVSGRSRRLGGEDNATKARRLGGQDSATKTCKAAFNVGCLQAYPFNTCCGSCQSATAQFSCEAHQHVGDFPEWSKTWSGEVGPDEAAACTNACNSLKDADICALCDRHFLEETTKECPEFGDIPAPKWCEKVCNTPALAAARPSSYALSQIQAAVVGILVLVAFVVGAVAVRNHRSSREEGYRPFNDQSVLAGTM